MAATESALTIHNDISMELPELAPNQGLEAFKDIVFGSAAGMIGKVIEYPFDTVKVRLQSQPDHLPLRYNGPLDCFRQSFQAEGLRGLYRGISAPMAGAAVENSCLFFSYRVVQELLQATYYSSTEPLPLTALVFSGAASGSITSLALTPIELIKCKMQVPSELSSARVGPLKLIVSVFRQDGVLGFWRGQLGTLIRETGGGAAWFGSYEGVSALFRSYQYSHSTAFSSEVESASLPLYQQMLAGAAAGVSYNFLFYPADTIKSRLQTEDINNTSSKRQTFGGAARALWHQQGLRGLYRGCGITCARSAPSSAFIFTVFEGLRSYFG
ncbi:putative mitochondrial ornithine carrier protein AmcA/Ort1 [Aspergillus foveolatus]|uniref:putative mitochondrial ornithine carrier protein AmcA/Ort1 n=1 Tax=Aspergillus foveolatus TaxID=210207 RepID=UPI003CCE1E58